MSDVVVPPDASEWWDVPSTTGDALAILRLTDVDVDAARIAALVPVAGQLINQFLDQPSPGAVIADPVVQALTYAVVELYRQKDSPPSTADDFGLSPGHVPADPLQPVRAMLAPYRRRWGLS
ncbi:MAG TPA: hypothetical protein VFP09_02945 [Desertimonas sp.]|nr:hypothetical protein [Desertimonas sp.]